MNWDSFPLKLFTKGNAKVWNPADIYFSRDAADWAGLTEKLEYIANDTYQVRMYNDSTILVVPSLTEGGRPARYLIRLDAKAVSEINARPRNTQPNYQGAFTGAMP